MDTIAMDQLTTLKSLLAQLPHPDSMPPAGVSDADLVQLSRSIGFKLPPTVARLLKLSNAPYINTQVLLGISSESHRDIVSTYHLFPTWQPRGWLPLGNDGCGNYYVVPTQQELGPGYPVLFVEAVVDADQPAYIVASNPLVFVQFLIERELRRTTWPFNKEQLLVRDPAITTYNGIALPWV